MDKGMITGLGIGAVFLGGAALATRGSGSLGAFIAREGRDPRFRFGKCRIWVTDVLDEGLDFPLSPVGWKEAMATAVGRKDSSTYVTLVCDQGVSKIGKVSIPMMQTYKGELVVEGTGGASKHDFMYKNEPV